MRATVMHAFPVVVVALCGTARAEVGEIRVGGGALAVFPALSPSEATQMASVGMGGRVALSLGTLHHRLRLLGRLSVWKHSGDLSEYRHASAEATLSGNLRYHGEGYRGELGIAWQAVGGYNLAPHLRAWVGYQWATFRDQALLAYGETFDAPLPDRGEDSATVGFGASLEQRIFNVVICGVSIDYTRAFSRLYRYDLSVSVTSSYYWF